MQIKTPKSTRYDIENIRIAPNAKELKTQSVRFLRQAFDASKKNGTVKQTTARKP